MDSKVKVKAVKAFYQDGFNRAAGEVFDLSPREAARFGPAHVKVLTPAETEEFGTPKNRQAEAENTK